MRYDAFFDTDENKTLLAISTRMQIRHIGYSGIGWGVINIGLGILSPLFGPYNIGQLVLGAVMLGTGIQALWAPSIAALFNEALLALSLFGWNVCALIQNPTPDKENAAISQLVVQLIVAVSFFLQYRRLKHIAPHIASVSSELINASEQMCRELLKRKPKKDPTLIVDSSGQCRAQLMANRAFFVQRNLEYMFVVLKDDVRGAIKKPQAKKIAITFRHPLKKLTYKFDKNNSEKLKAWLAAASNAGKTVSQPLSEPPAEKQPDPSSELPRRYP